MARPTDERQISEMISSLRKYYENLILCSALDNENDEDVELLSATGPSGLALSVHQEQITHTIQSLFKIVSELRAMRARTSTELS